LERLTARHAMVILVMGVAGSGKTTIGQLLARELRWSFADADDFHPPANVAKMAAGQPLDDADRAPWLAALRAHIEGCLARNENAVVACSALKSAYRATLVVDRTQVRVVHLHGSRELLQSRLQHRKGHFMRPEMLESQLATLEPPSHALTLDVSATPPELVARIRQAFAI
jgi:gluconokinase